MYLGLVARVRRLGCRLIKPEAAVSAHFGEARDGPSEADCSHHHPRQLSSTHLAAALYSSSAMLIVSVCTEGNVAFLGRSVGFSSHLGQG